MPAGSLRNWPPICKSLSWPPRWEGGAFLQTIRSLPGHVGIQCNTRSGNRTFLESDLVLGIGCRFNDRHTGDLAVYTKGRKFIHIDIDPMQIGKIIAPELGIVSDAKLALEALLRNCQGDDLPP